MTTGASLVKFDILLEQLMGASLGALVTYSQLSKAIGESVLLNANRILLTKAKIAAEKAGRCFKTHRNRGYERLTTNKINQVAKFARTKIRKTAVRTNANIGAALSTTNGFTNDERLELLSAQSNFGVIAYFSSEKNMIRAPAGTTQPLTVAQSLANHSALQDAFKKKR